MCIDMATHHATVIVMWLDRVGRIMVLVVLVWMYCSVMPLAYLWCTHY